MNLFFPFTNISLGIKQKKFQISNQHLGVNYLLGVNPNHWPWPKRCILHFSKWALWKSLVHTIKKVLFEDLLLFFNVFDHANTCASMHLLVEINNTTSFFLPQKYKSLIYSWYFQTLTYLESEISHLAYLKILPNIYFGFKLS